MVTAQGRSWLVSRLEQYSTPYAVEKAFAERFLALLTHPRAYHRDHLPGHVTGSAWIVDETRRHTLLTHHAKLNRWLQPGGHADGEEDIFQVALREAQEETGLHSLKNIEGGLWDIDIHPIPARGGFPDHLHYDVRFLFVADMDEPLTITAESNDLAWVSNADIATLTGFNVSMMRMAAKAATLT